MKVKLNTNLVPIFSGTYGNMWEVYETDDDGAEVDIEYDFKELMKSIIRAYRGQENYILSELNCDFITKIKFLDSFYSPREYNFKTDELDFELEIDEAKLLETVRKLENDKEFHKFLKDNYSSYDGFMSFTPNNYQEIKDSITSGNDDFDQSLGALIRYLANENIEADGGCSIEDMVHEDWNGNGYEGLDYKIIKE